MVTCKTCRKLNGKIFDKFKSIRFPPIHMSCRCCICRLTAVVAGTISKYGKMGGDWWIYYKKQLPSYYITKEQAEKRGWEKQKGNLSTVAPGKVIGGERYYNDDQKLPEETGRIWYEADINYSGGYRNNERIVYSNDGLAFYTMDHYRTFYEITG